MVSMKMAFIFGALGVVFLIGAIVPVTLDWGAIPELWLLCLWPASVYLLVATIYSVDPALGVMLIAKRTDSDGKLPTWAIVLLLPFFVVMWGVWLLRHTTCVPLSGERPYDRVADGIYVGRWPLRYPSEFPDDCPNWIDLTAEFPARRRMLEGRRYVCLPAMDCTLPENGAMLELADDAAGWDGDIYVSCANGHGRSACLAALIMLRRGHASDWKDAFRQMRVHRSVISIQPNQERVLTEIEHTMREQGKLPAARGDTTISPKGLIELSETAKARIATENPMSTKATIAAGAIV